MTETLLDICTAALDEISSFNVPTFIVGNEDDTARQLLALAKKVGRELVRDYDWQEMIREATFTTVSGTRAYDVEEDYERIVSDTTWDRTASRPARGNSTASQWNALRSLTVTTGPQFFFRVIRGQVTLDRDPGAGVEFAYEYLSKSYCESSGGTDQESWIDDTDVPLLPPDLFIAGVRYYFLKAKNLPYGDAEGEYDAIIASLLEKNVPSGAVNMAAGVRTPGRDDYRLNIPDRIDV